MISLFPTFSKLSLKDAEALQKYITAHSPHSDFNLAGLWSYDTENTVLIAMLNNNLVMQSRDYVTKKPFHSFLGSTKVDETIDALLSHSHAQQGIPTLRLLTEETIRSIQNPKRYTIQEDPDNFDYILSVENLVSMKGNKLGPKRNFVNRFNKLYGTNSTVTIVDSPDDSVEKKLLSLFYTWEKNTKKDRAETKTELVAMQKLLSHASTFRIYIVGLYINASLIGFSINEVIQQQHGVIHFEKADTSYIGIYEYLKQQSALHLQTLGCTYINYEQDLGIEGLRKAKLSYRPVHMIKKYTLTKA